MGPWRPSQSFCVSLLCYLRHQGNLPLTLSESLASFLAPNLRPKSPALQQQPNEAWLAGRGWGPRGGGISSLL